MVVHCNKIGTKIGYKIGNKMLVRATVNVYTFVTVTISQRIFIKMGKSRTKI